ncbi:multi protein bridging factor 1 domain-containing protein [Trichoderma austrokoningii]
MSDDWDSFTTIGSRARGPGANREKVIRGSSALNAANRSGAGISTERKYGGANSGGGSEGQRLTKVDRSDDIIKPKKVGLEVGKAIQYAREHIRPEGEPMMTRSELGQKIGQSEASISSYERGQAMPDQAVFSKLEYHLEVHLRGNKIGERKEVKKRQRKEA